MPVLLLRSLLTNCGIVLQVVGFDCVDDESKPERRPTKSMPKPRDWNNKYNAAYSYYIYYLYANLFTLNSFRQSRGLNTFTFRCDFAPFLFRIFVPYESRKLTLEICNLSCACVIYTTLGKYTFGCPVGLTV